MTPVPHAMHEADGPRASIWSRLAVAVAPAAALGVLALVFVRADGPPFEPPFADAPPGVAIVLLLTVAPLALRPIAPLPVLLMVAIGTIVTKDTDGAQVVHVLAGALASYTVGERASDRVRSALLVLVVAGLTTIGAIASAADPARALVIPFVVLVPAWLLGDAVRSRRIEAQRRDEDARRARHDLEAELGAAAADERRHVARELHDIVAHSVSVMVVQAGAARKVVHASPDRADVALAAVESTGREAMAELRRLLGALGDEDEPAGVAPQPGIGELPTLVGRVLEAGLPVRLEVDGDARPLPTGIDVTAYRIVQEALTNALRYAGCAQTLVRLRYEPLLLRIDVDDDGPAASETTDRGAGHGLIGMTERASMVGGRLEAGPRPGGGFAVRAWLPLGARSA